MTDPITREILLNMLDSYNNYYRDLSSIKKVISKVRLPNFPSEVYENVAKFAFYKYHGILPNWNTKKGDLVVKKNGNFLQIEVKASINLMEGGPSSFGPTEDWDIILFVDCIDTLKGNFKVYQVNLSNKDPDWMVMKLNSCETYGDICKLKKRPRIKFVEILRQLDNKYINVIFDGNISEL